MKGSLSHLIHCGSRSRDSSVSLPEEVLNQLLARQIEIGRYIGEDFSKCANSELFVGRDGDVVFPAFEVRCDSNVAPRLTSNFVAKTAQGSNESFAADVAGKFQAGITSSLTMWSRMTLGFSAGSKWQETASLIMVLSSSKESASVKMEKPSALAW